MDNALDFLIEQAREREQNAVMALNNANSELQNYYKQLEQIEQYRFDYCQQLVERGKGGLSASSFSHLNRFLTQLDETLVKQKEAESYFKDQVVRCEQHWFEMRKQKRSYEWLLEKKQKEKQRIENQREQKQLDEFTTLQYSRKSPGPR